MTVLPPNPAPVPVAGTQLFPEQTIRYRTYIKQTLVQALNTVFSGHPDQLIQGTKASIEFPKTEVDYPSVVVRFFEREIFNAGVGHEEVLWVNGESGSIEVEAQATPAGSVQLTWPAVENATGYNVYVGTVSDQEDQSFTVTSPSFIDTGAIGAPNAVPTEITADIDAPQPTAVAGPGGQLSAGARFYRVTALAPGEAVKFKHYFYNADIELGVYALSSYDRDLIADSLVQTIAMGSLEPYTNTFFERVYPSSGIYPDSFLHFINVGSDRIQGFGDNQTQVPWGAEDDLLYTTSYRFAVFGELYSLPPRLTYAMVQKIYLYLNPVNVAAIDPGAVWVSNTGY